MQQSHENRPRQAAQVARGRVRRVAVILVLLVTAGVVSPASAQGSPNGPELQVNSYTTRSQGGPAVAVDGPGNFVVAWMSEESSGTDTSWWSIQVRRFDAQGAPLGDEQQVNTYTTGRQAFHAVAADGQGRFVVAWSSERGSGTDTYMWSIQAQRYDADGVPLGGQFQVNTWTTGSQQYPAVGADGQGNFVVAWASGGSSGTDTSSWSIQAQRYDADGTPLGGEFQVNSYTTSHQRFPAVAVDSQSRFVVAWESYGSSGTDTNAWSIQGQRFDADGTPLGSQFQVNMYTPSHQKTPAVAVDDQGNFVVAWESYGSSGTDTSSWSIQAQRFDANGAPLGGELQVNSYTTGWQDVPAVAVDAQGRFVVAWESPGSSGTDTDDFSIQAQRFDLTGSPLGGEFQVNSYTTDRQEGPAVAVDGQGNFVVTWTSVGSNGTDTDGSSIQAQRFDALFRDGFEGGDTARWSAAIP